MIFILDLAIGSPNAEMVHVFRSYPVVKVIANVIPLTKELKITDTSFKFKVCWSLESKYELPNDTGKCQHLDVRNRCLLVVTPEYYLHSQV